MFKAVYFHKTVRAGEVMLLEAMSLAEDELGLSSLDLDEFLKLSDESVISKLLDLPEHNSRLKTSKKIAIDYLNRNLFKCVFERTTSSTRNMGIKLIEELMDTVQFESSEDGTTVTMTKNK